MRLPKKDKQAQLPNEAWKCATKDKAGRMTACNSLTWKRVAGVSILAALFCHLMLLSLQFKSRPDGVPAIRRDLTVLIWDWPFGQPLNLTGDVCATLYGIQGCHLTGNHRFYEQADVVMFHHRELCYDNSSFPRARRPAPGQHWVWVSLESPTHTKALTTWTRSFNWAMTYRQDSDIFMPYGKLVPRRSETMDIPRKTGLVTWVISNYRHTQKRAQWYLNLSRHLKIDVYGKASKKPLCPACLLPTISQYKFYLAFENSVHQDYITEKLWRNALLAGTVPVVMGPSRANYQKFLPANAFIHVEDFGSAQELAGFLTTMNDSHYRSYFEWKRDYAVKLYTDWRERFCTVCQRYPLLPKEKVYLDLERWFWS